MKLVIDVMGAPERSGGMRLYAEEIIRSWVEEFPDDELVIRGNRWIRGPFSALDRVTLEVIENESHLTRALSQLFGSALSFYRHRADALLSISSIVSPLVRKSRRTCVVHDWRHLKNPQEFGTTQRLYRRLWVISAKHAGVTICISPKTLAETQTYANGAHTVLVSNGGDHARRWPRTASASASASTISSIVTFGHHPNKRPELAIAALAKVDQLETPCQLSVLGATGQLAQDLQNFASSVGVLEHVSFPGFVSEIEYQDLVQNANTVALVSSDEGFGLPVAEARYFGIPCVVTSDNGLAEIHGEEVIECEPSPDSLAMAIKMALGAPGHSAETGALLPKWADTAKSVRSALAATLPE